MSESLLLPVVAGAVILAADAGCSSEQWTHIENMLQSITCAV
jgi:hypothetical protein